jgi:hypothetical protein
MRIAEIHKHLDAARQCRAALDNFTDPPALIERPVGMPLKTYWKLLRKLRKNEDLAVQKLLSGANRR